MEHQTVWVVHKTWKNVLQIHSLFSSEEEILSTNANICSVFVGSVYECLSWWSKLSLLSKIMPRYLKLSTISTGWSRLMIYCNWFLPSKESKFGCVIWVLLTVRTSEDVWAILIVIIVLQALINHLNKVICHFSNFIWNNVNCEKTSIHKISIPYFYNSIKLV